MTYRYRATSPSTSSPPQTPTPQRILQAAVELYGEHGFEPVTLKKIARRAGVSPPLVIHHFGSVGGLRQACDRHVAEEIRTAKTEAVRLGSPMPRHYALEVIHSNQHLLKYLLRAFAAGGHEMDDLFDKLVEDSLEYAAEAEEVGLVYPSADPRSRAVVMLLQSLGALMLHGHMKRHLGASPVDDAPEAALPYMSAVLELYTQPVINGQMYEELLKSQRDAEPQHHHGPGIPSTHEKQKAGIRR